MTQPASDGFRSPAGPRRVPPGWRLVRLADVVSEAQGGFASGERDPNGVVQLRMNNVTSRGSLDWSSVLRVPADSRTVERYKLQPGDVLFNNTNSTELVGKSALFVDHDEPVTFSNHFTRLRTIRGLLCPEYLVLWLRAQYQEGLFAAICNRWIGQSAVQRDRLLSLELPLPLLPEQQRIARLVTEQMTAVERARAAAEAELEAAKTLTGAYLKEMFESPEILAWPQRRLGDLMRLRKDVVHPAARPRGRAVFVGLEHIASGTGARVDSVSIEMAELTGRKPRFYEGDIVYGYLRPYLNKVWIAEFDGLCSVDQYVYAVDSQEAVTSFISAFMRSQVYFARAPVRTTPGQLPRIRTEEVASVIINLPPLVEQQRMVGQLEVRTSEAERMTKMADVQVATMSALPAALLRRAFSGEL